MASTPKLTPSKQIDHIQIGGILLTNIAYGSGATQVDVTTALTSAVSTAGRGNVTVPLQAGNDTTEGFATTSPRNKVDIVNFATGLEVFDASGNQVFGRLSLSGTTYILKLYSYVGGVETAYVPAAALAVSALFSYYFQLSRLPVDAITSARQLNAGADIRGGSAIFTDVLTPTAKNTLPALTYSYAAGGSFQLIVNGFAYDVAAPTPHYTVSGKTVSWTSTAFDLTTTDEVLAKYQI